MIILGIIGGVASGKSLVCEQFHQLGAEWIQADRDGHAVLREPAVLAVLRDRWGERILAADGQIDRSAVARIVFAPAPDGPRERRFLEQVTHPRIGARLHARLDELRRGETTSVVVLDAPLLLEAGWDRLCDALVFVAAPRALREQRARARGWTLEELDAREAAQQPLAEKQSRATWIIDNSREPAETAVRVAQIWQELRQRFPDKVPHTRPATGASRY